MSLANTNNGNVKKKFGWNSVIIGALVVTNCFTLYKVNDLTNQYNAVQEEVKQSREANEKVLGMLTDIRNEQQNQSNQLNKAMNITHRKRVQKHNVMQLKMNGFGEYTDLGDNISISVEDMNKIIDYYEAHTGKTAFSGHGSAFVAAAEETGLNPIYLFAHAACESGYGTSYLARTRHNYYGINAVDSNPGAASFMGDSLDEGIRSGARWIKSNFYDNGYTTLASMHAAGYATDPNWSREISDLANSATQLL